MSNALLFIVGPYFKKGHYNISKKMFIIAFFYIPESPELTTMVIPVSCQNSFP